MSNKVNYLKIKAYLELVKPELTSLSVLTAVCSFFLASSGELDVGTLSSLSLGTLLVGGGAGALNEYFERGYDALMKRTEQRPIPSGRIQPLQAFLFGNFISLVGLAMLAVFINLLTAFVAALTLTTYLMLYTPLKRIVWWNTLVGAVPGSLPTLVGWAAARNHIDAGAWVLFGILFAWQIPHFLSLAWMYKKDYKKAGFRMLPVFDEDGKRTSFHILIATLVLLGISLAVAWVGLAGKFYFVCSLLLGCGFFVYAVLFRITTYGPVHSKTNVYSRRIFFTSLLYLPALMLAMMVDKV